jgi:hypothetical protein
LLLFALTLAYAHAWTAAVLVDEPTIRERQSDWVRFANWAA